MASARLCALFHAASCCVPACAYRASAKAGEAGEEGECAALREAWAHLATCTTAACTVPHCTSSRACLAHYRNCTDDACAICAALRAAIAHAKALTRVH